MRATHLLLVACIMLIAVDAYHIVRKSSDLCMASSASPKMVKIPGFSNSWQVQRSNTFPDPEKIHTTLDLFYKKWKTRYGDPEGRVYSTLNNMMLDWDPKKKYIDNSGFTVDGKQMKGYVRGITLLPGYIWLWHDKRYDRIAASALVHELVHSALWAMDGNHGDPDHEGDLFEGWTPDHTLFISELNRELAWLDI